jgi:predicted short-subunit dehydrogenase-like oxidoreductase (DUF2520 family)
MRIVIIGSGNVATVISRIILDAKHTIIQVFSRDIVHAKMLADQVQANYTCKMEDIDTSANLYIFSVSDTALYELPQRLSLQNKLVLHTAGSIPKDVLQKSSSKYGVLYPLQSLRKEMEQIPPIPFLVDGCNNEVTKEIKEFAETLSNIVSEANDEERLKLHVAAVVVSNFTNHLYALSEDFCKNESVDFSMLFPLINETACRIKDNSAAQLQTGPALRNDHITLDKHIKLLSHYPKLRNLYLKITDSIMSV